MNANETQGAGAKSNKANFLKECALLFTKNYFGMVVKIK